MKKIMNLDLQHEFRYMSKGLGDISESILSAQEISGPIEKIRLDGKIVNLPKYVKRKVKEKTLKFGLDLDDPSGLEEYERRKLEAKEENMQKLREKSEIQDALLMKLPMSGDVYKRRRDTRIQKLENYEINLTLRKYGQKVKKML